MPFGLTGEPLNGNACTIDPGSVITRSLSYSEMFVTARHDHLLAGRVEHKPAPLILDAVLLAHCLSRTITLVLFGLTCHRDHSIDMPRISSRSPIPRWRSRKTSYGSRERAPKPTVLRASQ